jgi:uncharacterized surface anchored protein
MNELYDKDFNLWAEQMAIAIRERNVNEMDWNNLLEEIEDISASQKRALRNYYYRLAEHILKLRDWHAEQQRNKIKWRVEVTNFRRSINDIFDDSPSLKNYLEQNHATWFSKVIANYQKNELFLIEDTVVIPLEQMMDDNYFG